MEALGTEVDFGPGHILLDGDPALPSPERGTATATFRPMFIVAKGRPSQELLSSC